jgi:hypothetical protein
LRSRRLLWVAFILGVVVVVLLGLALGVLLAILVS